MIFQRDLLARPDRVVGGVLLIIEDGNDGALLAGGLVDDGKLIRPVFTASLDDKQERDEREE